MKLTSEHYAYFLKEVSLRNQFNDYLNGNLKTNVAELGNEMIALEKWDLKLFGIHKSGEKLLNRKNPHMRRLLKKAEKELSKKGFGKEEN